LQKITPENRKIELIKTIQIGIDDEFFPYTSVGKNAHSRKHAQNAETRMNTHQSTHQSIGKRTFF